MKDLIAVVGLLIVAGAFSYLLVCLILTIAPAAEVMMPTMLIGF